MHKNTKNKLFQNKVAYISDQQYPIEKADSEQTMNTVSALANAGLDIELIIPRKWRDFLTPNQKLKERLLDFYHVKDGFQVTELMHLPLSPLRLEKYSHGLIAPIYAGISKHDIIYTRNPMSAQVGLALQKKVIFETYRIYDRFKLKIAKRLGRIACSPNLLAIISHSIPSKESLLQVGVPEEKLAVIPNGFNPEHLKPTLTKTVARQKLGWNEHDKMACYTGRLDMEKGVDSILDLAERTPEIKYILIGNCQNDTDDRLQKVASQKGLKNIQQLPWIATKELSRYLFASDVLVIPPTAVPMRTHGKTVLPMKLFIYLAAGRPILAPALPDSRSVLNHENAALVEPDNLLSAQKTIRRIFEDKTWAKGIAEQAKLDSQNYTWERRAQKIIEFLNERLQDYES